MWGHHHAALGHLSCSALFGWSSRNWRVEGLLACAALTGEHALYSQIANFNLTDLHIPHYSSPKHL